MPVRPRRARTAALLATLALGAAPLTAAVGADAAPQTAPATSGATKAAPTKPRFLRLNMLAINDFHGQLETVPSTSSSGRVNTTPAGGAAYLSTHLKQMRQNARRNGYSTVTVAAGDLIGATPLLSAAFHDEPTIETMNSIGLDIASVGNHEFDEGYRELQRLQRGGCLEDGDGENNADSCPDPDRPFTGADFRYLAANVVQESSGRTILPAYTVRRYRGVKVGFIGLTLQATPTIVTAAGVEGLRFTDEVRTVRRLMPELRRKGVKSIVVLLHEGAVPTDPTQYDNCAGATGAGRTIARRLPAAVDAVVSGHTHQAYNCKVRDPKGRLRTFTSAASVGRLVTNISLRIDRRTGDVVRPASRARNRIVTNSDGTAPDPAILQLIDRYTTFVEPIAARVVGRLATGVGSVVRTPDVNGGDSPLGNLIADSMLRDPSVVQPGAEQPVIALMNPGGIRNDLVAEDDGTVTYGAAFSVQPFNNFLTSLSLTGEQLLAVLNEQWSGGNEGTSQKILQVAGVRYSYDRSLAASTDDVDAVVADSVRVDLDRDGTPEAALEPDRTYRVVTNSFLADGGDNFATLDAGTDKFVGGLDIDALSRFLQTTAAQGYTPTATDRISSVE